MEVINIEAQTFEAMMSRFESFVQKVEKLCEGQDKSLKKWFDNEDVCTLLNICPRTLQTLRDNGTLAFSQISRKTYYKPEDVEKIVLLVKDKRKRAKDRENVNEGIDECLI